MRRAVVPALLVLFCGPGCKQRSDDGGGGESGQSDGKPYRISIDSPAGGVGEMLTATVKLEPRAPYKVNLEYPTKLTVSGPAAAAPRSLRLTAKDAARLDEKAGVFRPSVKLREGGKHDFSAIFKFSVCTKELCELLSEKLTWTASAK